MHLRKPIEIELPWRDELTAEEHAALIQWAITHRHPNDVRVRGTDPRFPGSTFWKTPHAVIITMWPEQKRIWATHNDPPGSEGKRILYKVRKVLSNHPPTAH